MSYGVYGWLVWGAFVTLSAIAFFLYGWRSGQFRDVEEAKYRMLEDREPQGWPGREPKGPRDQSEGQPDGAPAPAAAPNSQAGS